MKIKKPYCFKTINGFPPQENLHQLIYLYTSIFEDAEEEFFIQRLRERKDILSLICFNNDKPIGFKIGYNHNNTTFYSWVGGVLPNFRRQGIATEFIKIQEDYIKKHQYKTIRTKSMNCFKPMLILNIKNEFDIKQVYTNEIGQTKIIFEKNI